MRRRYVFPLLLAAFALPLAAQDPPKTAADDDPVAAKLLADKEAYTAALEKARENLLKAFDRQYELVKNNKSLKLNLQVAALEKLEAEKKTFEESEKLPTAAQMKVAVSEFRTAQKRASDQCKVAFDKAAKAYRDKGDVKATAATLEEAKEFLATDPVAIAKTFLIVCRHSGKVLVPQGAEGSRVITADPVKGDEHQVWTSQAAGGGWFYLVHKKSGLVATVNGNVRHNGPEVLVNQKSPSLAETQVFRVGPVADNKQAYKFYTRGGKVFGINGKSSRAGAHLVIWADENAHHMQFITPTPEK
jgi:hypothetical protein